MDPITLDEVAVNTDVRGALPVSSALYRISKSFVLFTSQMRSPVLECSIVKGLAGKVWSVDHLREPLAVVQVNIGV